MGPGHVLSTRQAGRNEDLWAAYGQRITSQILPKGNVVIFAPSADVVQQLLPHLPKDDRPLRVETPQWKQEDRLAVCDELRKRKDTGCILVAYFRGGFSEGIDLPGGVIPQIFLIGLPLATWNLEAKATVAYYQRVYGDPLGKDMAYNVPAITQAVQAAGRGIRSESDVCSIHFLDQRYTSNVYSRLLPDEYRAKRISMK